METLEYEKRNNQALHHKRMTNTSSPRAAEVLISRADEAARLREAISFIKNPIGRSFCVVEDIPEAAREEAITFLQNVAHKLRMNDFEPFREGGRQLSEFSMGNFRFSSDGGHYGDGPPVQVMGVTLQFLREMRMKHLRQRVLPRLERELATIVDGLEVPGIVARTFSKTARTASRKIKHITLER